jgi:NitT/TauT family transport system substrate-binding protein
MPQSFNRRQALGMCWAGCAAAGVSACGDDAPAPLRFAAQPWPGYEMLFLARRRGYMQDQPLRLIETPSASASLRALANRTVEGAALTLDEVLTGRARGLPLVVVAVVDVSMGADVVLVRPGKAGPLKSLEGRTVGVEPSATGAVMLAAYLESQRLLFSQIHVMELAVDQHVNAYRNGLVDALVTYEPACTLLKGLGAQEVFSSAAIPGRIVDTLAMRKEVLQTQPDAVRQLVGSHFRALHDWRADPQTVAPLLAVRLQLPPDQVAGTFSHIDLPDVPANQAWLGAPPISPPRLMPVAGELQQVMLRAALLPRLMDLSDLADARFLP